jgi:hypothetical protein
MIKLMHWNVEIGRKGFKVCLQLFLMPFDGVYVLHSATCKACLKEGKVNNKTTMNLVKAHNSMYVGHCSHWPEL